MDQINFFENVFTGVLCCLLPDYTKVESFGKKFCVVTKRHALKPWFFIRFTDGNIVMLGWSETCKALCVAATFDGGSEVDFSFEVTFKNTLSSAITPEVFTNIQASLSNPHLFPWNEETWCSELRDVIFEILEYAEVNKLADLFIKNGATSNGC